MDPVLVRRVLGTATVVLVIGLTYLAMSLRYAPSADTYTVEALLGRAGSGLAPGIDVKARGVRIGRVDALRYTDGEAIATLRIDGDVELPAPADLELVVTAKTLLGEKQVEISFPDDRFGQAPFLAQGDTIVADRAPTELQEVLDELSPFLDAIDGQQLATIVDTLADQRGEAATIVENIELGSELAAFGERTADDNLRNLRNLSDAAETLAPAIAELTRLNRAVPDATAVLRERQQQVRRNLDQLASFSVVLASFVEAEEPAISTLVRSSDAVGALLERQARNVGSMIQGVAIYGSQLGRHGGDLDDGSEFAFFRIFLGGDGFDPVQLLCDEADAFDSPVRCPEGSGAAGAAGAGGR
jgi:phospholipid/cholesterol/gamma-HCH transport system substrate-binding protein